MGPGCSVRSANATTGGDGFDLHANVAIAANNREGLEQLARDVLRPPIRPRGTRPATMRPMDRNQNCVRIRGIAKAGSAGAMTGRRPQRERLLLT
jgi:hypothetical protein